MTQRFQIQHFYNNFQHESFYNRISKISTQPNKTNLLEYRYYNDVAQEIISKEERFLIQVKKTHKICIQGVELALI